MLPAILLTTSLLIVLGMVASLSCLALLRARATAEGVPVEREEPL